MPKLELRNVGVRYGSIVGTDGISLILEPGQTVSLVGSNGAGKSSTLKAIIGLAAYPTGDILLDGRDISARPIASICCSPPDRLPARCDERSFRRGK